MQIYLIGGQAQSGEVLNETLAFDPIFEMFNTSLAPMLTPRYRFAAAAVEHLIYVVGGVEVTDGVPVSSIHVYDTTRDVWTPLPANMSQPRSDLAAAAYGGKVYVMGGYGVNYDMSIVGTLTEVYDPASGAWSVLAPMATSRGDLVAITYGDRIFVMGGWNDALAVGGDFTAAVEAFSPRRGKWTTHANMLVRKGDTSVALYRNRIVTVGGELWSGTSGPCPWDATLVCRINQVPSHDTTSFAPDTEPATNPEAADVGPNAAGSVAGVNGAPGVWVPHAPLPAARYRFAAAAHVESQAVFVFGGTQSQGRVSAEVSAFYDTTHPQVFVHYKEGADAE